MRELYYSGTEKILDRQSRRKQEVSKFITQHPKHVIVKRLKRANENRDRKLFHKLLTKIHRHIYVTKMIKAMRENCDHDIGELSQCLLVNRPR